MEQLFVLKDTNTGKYYSDDNAFIEPNKQFAKRLRKGQAESIKFNHNKFKSKPIVIMEEIK